MPKTSYSGEPSTIHSAMTLPTPPAAASPWTQNPAATHNPATAVSPSRNSPSGVNASGPWTTLAKAAASWPSPVSMRARSGSRRPADSHDSRNFGILGWKSVRGSASGVAASQTSGVRM